MLGSNTIPALDHLLVHDSFVRALARALVDDSAAADDVVQETYVRALRTPVTEPGHERAFLAVVVKNVIHSMRRRAARFRGPVASRRSIDIVIPDPADILAREAKRREVVEAVLSLDPPYRDAILLRYFEELPAERAAERLGIPLNTFLSRVHRARAELRRRVVDDSRDGDLAIALVTQLAGRDSTTIAGTFASFALPVALGVAALLAVSLLLIQRNDDAAAPSIVAAGNPAVVSATTSAVDASPVDPLLARVIAAPPVREETSPYVVRGSVIDLDGLRIAGARVTANGPDGRIEGTTDSNGEFELHCTKPALLDLIIDSPRHFAREYPRVATANPANLDARLIPGTPFRGQVVDSETGQGVPGATLVVGLRGPAQQDFAEKCDDQGRFATLAPRRGIELSVAAEGYERSMLRPFAPVEGESVMLRITRTRADSSMFVRLRDAAGKAIVLVDAQPGPITAHGDVVEIGATHERGFGAGRTVTQLDSKPGPKPNSKIATFRSSESISRRARIRCDDGREFEIRLGDQDGKQVDAAIAIDVPAARDVVGRVVDAEGRPVAGAHIAYFLDSRNVALLRELSAHDGETTSGADGSFRVERMTVGTTLRFAATHADGACLAATPFTVTADSELPVASLALEKGRSLAGSVVRGGHPVVGARVTATPSVTAHVNPKAAAGSPGVLAPVVTRTAFSDENGHFAFRTVPESGSLEVAAEGSAPTTAAWSADSADLHIELVPELVLVGRVLDTVGRPVPGARVQARKATVQRGATSVTTFGESTDSPSMRATQTPADEARTEIYPYTSVSDGAGNYRVRGLPEGTYILVADIDSAASDPFLDATAPESPDIAKPHDLVLHPTAAIFGKVRDSVTDRPAETFQHFVESATTHGSNRTMGQARSSFVHVETEGSPADVGVTTDRGDELVAVSTSVPEGAWKDYTFELPISLPRTTGGAELNITLDSGLDAGARIALVVPRAEGGPEADAIRVSLLGHSRLRARLVDLAPGEYRVEVSRPDGSRLYCAPESISLTAGQATTLVLTPR